MPQLRDAQTSELLAEGSPAELVALADAIGAGEVLFDDVGVGFSPAAVRAAAEANITGLEALAAGTPTPTPSNPGAPDKAARDAAAAAAKAARAELTPTAARLDDVRKRLAAARARRT